MKRHEIVEEMYRAIYNVVRVFSIYEEILSGIVTEIFAEKRESFHIILSPLPHEGENLLADLLLSWARQEGLNDSSYQKGDTYGLKPLEGGFIYSSGKDEEYKKYPQVKIF